MFKNLINIKKLQIKWLVIKCNNKNYQKFCNKLKDNNKNMVFKHHMLIQNIIKLLKN